MKSEFEQISSHKKTDSAVGKSTLGGKGEENQDGHQEQGLLKRQSHQGPRPKATTQTHTGQSEFKFSLVEELIQDDEGKGQITEMAYMGTICFKGEQEVFTSIQAEENKTKERKEESNSRTQR